MIAELFNRIAEEEQGERYKFYPRPSSAGPDRCIRSLVYDASSVPSKPFTGRTLLVFDDGSWHEQLSMDWLRKSVFKVHSEQMKVKCPPPFTWGHIDFMVTTPLKIDILVEHKAINHFSFQRYWDDEYPFDYLTQCALYSHGIQTHLNPACKWIILLLKNKNTAQYLELFCNYDIILDNLHVTEKILSTGETKGTDEYPLLSIDNIVKDACNKFYSVFDYRDKKTLPRRPFEIDDWHCQYCGWGDICWEGYEQEFKTFEKGQLPDAAEAIKKYFVASEEKKKVTKLYDVNRDTIKALMIENNLNEAVVENFLCRLTLTKDKKHRLYIKQIK